MDRERIKKINNAIKGLNDIKSDLEDIMEEEDAYRDSMPDNIQDSEEYEISEESSGYLEEAIESIENVLEILDAAKEA